jgi:hypothetical protein
MWQKLKIFKNTLSEIMPFCEVTFLLFFWENGLEKNLRWHPI